MDASFILALDQGTSSSRAIIFDRNSKIVSSATRKFPQYQLKNAWVEHDAMEIWASQMLAVAECFEKANLSHESIKAIGIANQRETTVIWDKNTGIPVYNAIVWQCRRTADFCDELKKSELSEIITQKTGLIVDPYFSASKIKWILDNVAGARQKAEKGDLLFGTIDCWLLWKLTAGKAHKTDHSNASRTMLFNINTLAWDDELLKIFDIPASLLPEVCMSSSQFGFAHEKFISSKAPITAMAGDQQAALFGQLCVEKGDLKNTYGTGSFVLVNIGEELIFSKNGLLTSLAASFDGKVSYVLEGSIFTAGAVVQWLRDDLQIINTVGESEDCAVLAGDNNGVYFVPAFVGLGAPHWDPSARGIIVGITKNTNRQHIVRAALESMAYQTKDICDAISSDLKENIKSIKVDGGAAENNFLMQFQADVLDKEILRSDTLESTALGVAYLAGLEVGFWENLDEIKNNHRSAKIFKPNMPQETRKLYLKMWSEAVKRSQNWVD